MKKIMGIIYVFSILLMPVAHGELIQQNNYSFSIEPILEPRCGELIENVFRIERLNHSTGMDAEHINYTTECNNKTTKIHKEIKKYSESKTGSCTFVESKNYSLNLTYNDELFEWIIPVQCKTEIEIEEQKIEPVCFEDIEIRINRQLFEKGEQLTMDFFLDKNPDFLEITYWIETFEGKIIKKKRTTNNIDRKKHTFQTITKPLEGAYVKAIFKDNCSQRETKQLIILQGEEEIVEQIIEQETRIEIQEIKQINNDLIEVMLLLQRGESRSSVIALKVLNEKNNSIYTEKITLREKNSALILKTILPIKNEKEVYIIIEGLGLKDEKQIILTRKATSEIIKAYTKQKQYTTNLTWYVRTKQKGTLLLEIISGNKSTSKIIMGEGEQTTKMNIPYQGGKIHSVIYDNKEKITLTEEPNITRKVTEQQKEKTIQIKNKKEMSPKLTTVKPIKMMREPEEKERTTIKRGALYGLFGSIIAGSTYLLLKEQ